MAIDLQRFVARFIGEARDQLSRLTEGLGRLEQQPGDAELVNLLLRAAHTLKGSARMLKLAAISDTAHRLEDLLGMVRDGRPPDPALISLLLAGVDGIGALVDQVAAGNLTPTADDALLAALAQARAAAPVAAEAPSPAGPGPAAVAPASPGPVPAAPQAPDSVRVPLNKLDELVRLIGEVMSLQQQLGERLRQALEQELTLRDLAAARADSALLAASQAQSHFVRQLRADLQAQEQLTGSLSDSALVLRMLPLSMVFEPASRMVRELARTLGKEVRCEVSGGAIELDRQIIERLGGALVHVLRNAVDHGIEPPEQRRAAGKPAVGRVWLHARAIGGGVMVEVGDDGRGFDRARILARALARGLVDAEIAAAMTDEEVWELVYAPGLSTSEIITDLSGRGVGMDAVRGTIIDGLHGTIGVTSQAGVGSRLEIKLPLSLAVMRLLLFTAAGQMFALAAQHVVELLRVGGAETILLAGRPAVVLRNEFIPLVPLAELLHLPRSAPVAAERCRLVLVIGVRQAKLGLVIDRLVDERDMVIKALPEHLRGSGLTGGIVVAGDGTLVCLLQAAALMEAARRGRAEATGREAADADRSPRKDTGRSEPWRVLVVDDSLNTREIVRDVLEAYGYQVSIAEDGLDGWQKAIGGHFDAILTDVEMPGLDGFSLTARLRGHERHRATPIIILTSRASEEDKRRGIAVGADAYLVKGDFDQAGLLDTLANLLGAAA